jgi:type 1 glutamine amidotransferase
MRNLLAITFLLAWAAPSPCAQKVRVLILTGESDLPYHDWRVTTPFLRGVLEDTGRFEVKVEEEVRGITASTLAGYDALVLHYNGPRWGAETERAVEDFLRSGKGMIAVHGVSYGPFYGQDMTRRQMVGAPWPAYADMMGMTWKIEDVGHSARHIFTVKWVDRQHPISRGLDPVFQADDELYHKMDFKPNVHVLATAYSDPKQRGTGKDEPIAWIVPFGSGRVVHTSLGHDLRAMSRPGFVQVFARGAEWAATGAVTLPAELKTYSRRD